MKLQPYESGKRKSALEIFGPEVFGCSGQWARQARQSGQVSSLPRDRLPVYHRDF